MGFNGSGTFLVNSAGQPVVTGTVISSSAFNLLTQDIANGLTACITKDGQTPVTDPIELADLTVDGDLTVTGDVTITGSINVKTPVISLSNYSPAGDGVTDDLTPLTDFLNDVMASTNRIGIMGVGVFGISAALPQINVSGVKLYGVFPGFGAAGAPIAGTVIKKIGVTANVDMLTVAPVADGSHYALSGNILHGIGFDGGTGSGRARKLLIWKSVNAGDVKIHINGEPSTCGTEVGCVGTLGGTTDPQWTDFEIHGYMAGSAGIGLMLTGAADRDVGLNNFKKINIAHDATYAIESQASDNNRWGQIRLSHLGGSASYCWNVKGNDDEGASTRYEELESIESTVPMIIRATGVTYPARWINIRSLRKSQGTPDPVIETGAVCRFQYDDTPIFNGVWTAYTPTITADAGTITTKTGAGRYQLVPNGILLQISVTVTTNGTGSGAVRATLPTSYPLRTGSLGTLAGLETNGGFGLVGVVTSGGTYVRILKSTDGSYPAADGTILWITGFIELTATAA